MPTKPSAVKMEHWETNLISLKNSEGNCLYEPTSNLSCSAAIHKAKVLITTTPQDIGLLVLSTYLLKGKRKERVEVLLYLSGNSATYHPIKHSREEPPTSAPELDTHWASSSCKLSLSLPTASMGCNDSKEEHKVMQRRNSRLFWLALQLVLLALIWLYIANTSKEVSNA